MFFWLMRAWLVPMAYLFWRAKVENAENIPVSGPVMLIANHQSNLDPVFLACANPRRMFAMGKSELFESRLSAWFYGGLGALPIHRGRPDRKGLKKILELFYQGNMVLVFPEGGRNHNPGLGPLEPGVVFLADLADVPVLPAGITGSGRIIPPGKKLPRFHTIKVKYGRPFRLDEISPRAEAKTGVEKKHRNELILERVRQEIIDLSDDAW
ncbi:MAG: lysophospholipid acyltransferase family protein [Actinomycetota bacterium]